MSQSLSSALLLLGVLNGALVLMLLMAKRSFRPATHLLMFFILLLLGRTLIYVLGKDALYDPHSWLYVPLAEVSLAYGPCLYLYLTYTIGRQCRWQDLLHLLPLAGQLAYYTTLLLLPKAEVAAFLADVHTPLVSRLEGLLVALSMTAYLLMSWRKYFSYQHWLDTQHSDADNFRMRWLRTFLMANSAFFIVWCGFSLKAWWFQSSFDSDLGLFVVQSALLSLLALESWRHADLTFPPLSLSSDVTSHSESPHLKKEQTRAAIWLNTIQSEQCWRDPQLSLPTLAAKLGTNTSSLSAAINQGYGENFNTVINRLRVEWVCTQLEQSLDASNLLQVAYDAGFNSKNSFNRNFRKFTGMSPSEYRSARRTKS